jgi:catalase
LKTLSIASLSPPFADSSHNLRHSKAIGAVGDGEDVLAAAHLPTGDEGVCVGGDAKAVMKKFIEALGQHRVWSRAQKAESVPA